MSPRSLNILYSTLLFVLIFILVGVAILLKAYVGYISVSSQGGYITELTIEQRTTTSVWQGFYGLALMVQGFTEQQSAEAEPGEINSNHLIFDCLEPNINHEVYATNVSPALLDFSTARVADPAWVDSYFGVNSSQYDSANRTFINDGWILLGGTNITGLKIVYTKKYNVTGNTSFFVGVLNVSNVPVFVTNVSVIQRGFNNQQLNYQLLLPAPNTTTYYFLADPYDDCPEGLSTGVFGNGFLNGTAYDNSTGLVLPGVTVGLGGGNTITNVTGDYNMSVASGTHYIVGIKSGYRT